MLWIARLEQAPIGLTGPVVWTARHADAAGWPLPPPTREDFADAAMARRDGGGPRLLRRRMLRALAARTFGLHPAAIGFARDGAGAPRLVGAPAHLSAAGCEGWSAVALGPTSLGVDIEPHAGGDPAELHRWTLVEAYLKGLGAGLNVAPERVGVDGDLAHGSGVRLRLIQPDSEGGGPCRSDARGWLHAPTPEIIAAAVTHSA